VIEDDANGDTVAYLTKKIDLLTLYIIQAPPTMSFKEWENGQGG